MFFLGGGGSGQGGGGVGSGWGLVGGSDLNSEVKFL